MVLKCWKLNVYGMVVLCIMFLEQNLTTVIFPRVSLTFSTFSKNPFGRRKDASNGVPVPGVLPAETNGTPSYE